MIKDFRLTSIIKDGIGGAECEALDLIYVCLLREFEQNTYKRIAINQVGEDLDEFVVKDPGNKIHCNIRYPYVKNFKTMSVAEKNKIRLDCIHTALLRIAKHEKKLDESILEKIKNKILDNNFSFEFTCKSFLNKKDPNIVAKIIVNPQIDKFIYYLQIEKNNKVKCKVEIIKGTTANFFGEELFNTCKWQNDNELIIYSKETHEVDIYLFIDTCIIEIRNLTPYKNPPFFTMRRADISKEAKSIAHEDWLHSLPPANAAILRKAFN